MEVQEPRRQLEREQKTVSGRQAAGALPKINVCSFWLAGRCNRNPYWFLHSRMPLSEISEPKQFQNLPQKHKIFPKSRTWQRETNSSSDSCSTTSTQSPRKTGRSCKSKRKSIYKSPTQPPSENGESHKRHCQCESPTKPPSKIDDSHKKNNLCESPTQPSSETEGSHNKKSICKSCNTVCKDWIDGSCVQGDKCEFLHKWSFGNGFSLVTKLEGHENTITGIAPSSSSKKLVTVGKGKTMRIWDGNNGQCLSLDNFDDEIDCMTAEGPFIFMGMQNTIKGWDNQNHLSINLYGSSDKVNVVVVEGDKIFSGIENGSILGWKANASGYPDISEPLMGHKDVVICLRIGVGGSRMFSGSRDNTIIMRDLNNMECMETLYGHTSTVTSLLCWDTYLVSGTSDRTKGVITMEGIHIYDPSWKSHIGCGKGMSGL